MGSLRTFLALTVVIGHSYDFVFTGAALAVQIFYLISGFLISYILVEARSYDRPLPFYLNRFFRLFPIYWVTAVGTIITLAAAQWLLGNSPPAVETFAALDWDARLALIFSNLFIFGQDWIMFTAVTDGVFQFSGDYRDTDVMVWQGLLIPPAWTLGVELSFYLIAPFILFSKRLMILLFLASLTLRLTFIWAGFGLQDPWHYRFFPTELAVFLAGALSHQVLMPWLRARGLLSAPWAHGATLLVFGYCVVYFLLPYRGTQTVLLLVLVTAALPFLFDFQRRHRWDRRIGDLSYPIYITHWSIMVPVSVIWDTMKGTTDYKGWDETFALIVLTLVASLLLNWLIADPIEKVRARVRRSGGARVPQFKSSRHQGAHG